MSDRTYVHIPLPVWAIEALDALGECNGLSRTRVATLACVAGAKMMAEHRDVILDTMQALASEVANEGGKS